MSDNQEGENPQNNQEPQINEERQPTEELPQSAIKDVYNAIRDSVAAQGEQQKQPQNQNPPNEAEPSPDKKLEDQFEDAADNLENIKNASSPRGNQESNQLPTTNPADKRYSIPQYSAYQASPFQHQTQDSAGKSDKSPQNTDKGETSPYEKYSYKNSPFANPQPLYEASPVKSEYLSQNYGAGGSTASNPASVEKRSMVEIDMLLKRSQDLRSALEGGGGGSTNKYQSYGLGGGLSTSTESYSRPQESTQSYQGYQGSTYTDATYKPSTSLYGPEDTSNTPYANPFANNNLMAVASPTNGQAQANNFIPHPEQTQKPKSSQSQHFNPFANENNKALGLPNRYQNFLEPIEETGESTLLSPHDSKFLEMQSPKSAAELLNRKSSQPIGSVIKEKPEENSPPYSANKRASSNPFVPNYSPYQFKQSDFLNSEMKSVSDIHIDSNANNTPFESTQKPNTGLLYDEDFSTTPFQPREQPVNSSVPPSYNMTKKQPNSYSASSSAKDPLYSFNPAYNPPKEIRDIITQFRSPKAQSTFTFEPTPISNPTSTTPKGTMSGYTPYQPLDDPHRSNLDKIDTLLKSSVSPPAGSFSKSPFKFDGKAPSVSQSTDLNRQQDNNTNNNSIKVQHLYPNAINAVNKMRTIDEILKKYMPENEVNKSKPNYKFEYNVPGQITRVPQAEGQQSLQLQTDDSDSFYSFNQNDRTDLYKSFQHNGNTPDNKNNPYRDYYDLFGSEHPAPQQPKSKSRGLIFSESGSGVNNDIPQREQAKKAAARNESPKQRPTFPPKDKPSSPVQPLQRVAQNHPSKEKFFQPPSANRNNFQDGPLYAEGTEPKSEDDDTFHDARDFYVHDQLENDFDSQVKSNGRPTLGSYRSGQQQKLELIDDEDDQAIREAPFGMESTPSKGGDTDRKLKRISLRSRGERDQRNSTSPGYEIGDLEDDDSGIAEMRPSDPHRHFDPEDKLYDFDGDEKYQRVLDKIEEKSENTSQQPSAREPRTFNYRGGQDDDEDDQKITLDDLEREAAKNSPLKQSSPSKSPPKYYISESALRTKLWDVQVPSSVNGNDYGQVQYMKEMLNSSEKVPVIPYCFDKYRNVNFRPYRGYIFN